MPTETIPIVHLTAVLAPTGLSLHLTAPVFEEFFSRLGGRSADTGSNRELYGGARYYEADTSIFSDFSSGTLTWGDRQLLQGGRPNISILRAVGIGQGIDITIQTVLNKRQMGEYLKAFEEAAIEFYAQYIRPESYELTITAEHSAERA
jgi:hypothetical protein